MILAVDLAAKYSAVCHLGPTGQVVAQWDSWGCPEAHFIASITSPWHHDDPPLVLVIEDLPHRLAFAALVKQVCRLQGRIIERMDRLGMAHLILFAPPAEWRKSYPGLHRGTGSDAVVPVAANLGYVPPDLSDRAVTAKERATARKVATDYCAAYLIAQWALANWDSCQSFDAPGTSRYTTLAETSRSR